MSKYYLSLANDALSSVKFADSPYLDTIDEVEDYLRKNYKAMDHMWVTTFDDTTASGFSDKLSNVARVLQDGDSLRWGRIVKSSDESKERLGHGTDKKTKPETSIGLSSLIIQLTGNRTAELNESDKIDIVTPDGNHRFTIDELRMIVKFFDATRITNNN